MFAYSHMFASGVFIKEVWCEISNELISLCFCVWVCVSYLKAVWHLCIVVHFLYQLLHVSDFLSLCVCVCVCVCVCLCLVCVCVCVCVCVRERERERERESCKTGTFCRPLDSKWQFLVDNVDLLLHLQTYFLSFCTSFLAVGVSLACC